MAVVAIVIRTRCFRVLNFVELGMRVILYLHIIFCHNRSIIVWFLVTSSISIWPPPPFGLYFTTSCFNLYETITSSSIIQCPVTAVYITELDVFIYNNIYLCRATSIQRTTAHIIFSTNRIPAHKLLTTSPLKSVLMLLAVKIYGNQRSVAEANGAV